MKHFTLMALILAITCAIFAQNNLFIVNSNSRTLSKVNLQTYSVNNNFAQVGLYANHIAYHNGILYVVDSGDNRLRMVNAETGNQMGFIPLANSSNPWHINIHNDFAYVTGMMTNALYKIDLSTHQVTPLTVGTAPAAMVVSGNTMYVSLTGYGAGGYGQGRIAVVDLDTYSVTDHFLVPTNPQEMLVDDWGYLHIVCTGNYGNETTIVAVVHTTTGEIIQTIPFPQSFFVSMQWGADGMVYVGNGLELGFVVYDPYTYEVINDAYNTAYPGGQVLLYDTAHIYVLCPSSYFASNLKVYSHSDNLLQTLTLGVASVAMCFDEVDVPDSDIVISPSNIELYAYPNPFKENIYLLTRGSNEDYTIDIFNAKGQRVSKTQHYSEGQTIWDGKDYTGKPLPNGIYFIRARNQRENIVKKVIKMK